MWVWLVAGLTGAILSFRFWDLGVTFTGAFGGFALAMGIIAVANLSITNAGRYVILGILVLGGATIATFFERLFIIIWTSCGGAYMFMFGVDQFAQVGYREIIVIFDFTGKTLQYHPNLHVYLMLGFSLVLASLGIGWEFWHHEKPVLMDRRAIFRIYGRPFGKRPHKLIGQRIHHHLKNKSDLYAYFLGCVCLQRTTIEDVLYNSDSCGASDIGHPVPGESPISGDQPSSTEEGHAGVTKEPITVISASSDNSPLKSAPLADSAEKHPELLSGISTSVDSSANSAVLSAASPSSEDISGSTAHLESSKDPSAQASRTTHIITSTSSHTESHHTESDAMFNPIPAARPEPHHPLFSPNLGARTLEMLRLVTEDLTPGNTIPRDYVPLNERAAVTAPVSFIWPPSVTASSASASARSSTSFLSDEQVDSQGLHIFEFSENTESDYESQEPEILESGQKSKAPPARTTADKTMVAVEDRHGFIENGDIDVDGCEVKKEPEEEEVKQEDAAEPQVWRLFSRIRKTVPETQRLENLTWRMTAMTLHKKQDGKQEEKLASTINAADIAVGPPR
ncbi:hypothetical protein BGZ99_006233 [Dissophora globulifera]|uniref:DUF4203 domain-containing protein n=1 Tax=Dissophora globulifera TaxID=979702 RepID=A0A9P6RGW1_9FUNG|nr:hypothetical protein BGZ99_006233 [Dissophora globulifera]